MSYETGDRSPPARHRRHQGRRAAVVDVLHNAGAIVVATARATLLVTDWRRYVERT